MKPCRDQEILISMRAAGALAADESARLEAHLVVCRPCRREAEAIAEVLGLAKLPPPMPAQRRALLDLPEQTLAAYRAGDERAGSRRRIGIAIAAAAVLGAIVLAPSLLRRESELPPPALALATIDAPAPAAPDLAVTPASWEGPDLEAVWEDAEVVDVFADDGDTSGAALAVLDDAAPP